MDDRNVLKSTNEVEKWAEQNDKERNVLHGASERAKCVTW